MNDLEYKLKTKESYSENAKFWISNANRRLEDFGTHLTNLATLLLPISASIILTPISLDDSQKKFLILGWVFLFGSIIFGLIQTVVDANYFRKLSRDSSKREVIWSDTTKPTKTLEGDTKALGYMPVSSTHKPLYLQILTFFVGFALIMFVARAILLKS